MKKVSFVFALAVCICFMATASDVFAKGKVETYVKTNTDTQTEGVQLGADIGKTAAVTEETVKDVDNNLEEEKKELYKGANPESEEVK